MTINPKLTYKNVWFWISGLSFWVFVLTFAFWKPGCISSVVFMVSFISFCFSGKIYAKQLDDARREERREERNAK